MKTNNNKPQAENKCRMLSWQFDSELKQYVISYLTKDSLTENTILPNNISADKNFIQKFSIAEANCIGYMAGYNDCLAENL